MAWPSLGIYRGAAHGMLLRDGANRPQRISVVSISAHRLGHRRPRAKREDLRKVLIHEKNKRLTNAKDKPEPSKGPSVPLT